MPNGETRRRRVWPWVLGGTVVVGAGVATAVLLWPRDAKADDVVPPGPVPPVPPGPVPPVPPVPPGPPPAPEPPPDQRIDTGNPPNVSGNPAGYNTTIFPSVRPVRLALRVVGYDVPVSLGVLDVPLNPPIPGTNNVLPSPYWLQFQGDWNRVIRAIASGKIPPPKTSTSTALYPFRGLLRGTDNVGNPDGIGGPYSLRALEITVHNQQQSGVHWKGLVALA